MLGIAGAAAIADNQQLVAATQRCNDRGRDSRAAASIAASRVARSSAASDCFRWAAIGSLVQNAPSQLQLEALVMIASPHASVEGR